MPSLAQTFDWSVWAEAASKGGVALIFILFLVGLAIYVLPWISAQNTKFLDAMATKEKEFVVALKDVTDSHERANERNTKAIEHVAKSVEGVKAEVSRLRDDILERNQA